MSSSVSRLYYDDPYLTDFSARVVSCYPKGDLTQVVLDKTAFYPTSGGQPHDTGCVASIPVLDVVEQGDEVIHVLQSSGTGLSVDDVVKCHVDWERRLDHMQQHAGQHALSAAVERCVGAKTIGFHISNDYSTIDLEMPDLTWGMVEEIEDLVNRVIFENRPITSRWVTRADMEKLDLRKPTERETGIRLVEVADFDMSACGGTHPRSTGEIGMVKVLKWERIRQSIRIHFVCGLRALEEFRVRNLTLVETASLLSVSPVDVAASVRSLLDQMKSLTSEIKALKEQNLRLLARDLCSTAEAVPLGEQQEAVRLVSATLQDTGPSEVRCLASSLVENPRTVAMVAGTAQSLYLVFARSSDIEVDMRPILKEALSLVDGKGGGSPHFAQGGGTDASRASEALAAAAAQLRSTLMK